ncbi:MAG: MFS transporter [Alphaproteobacteria bacterium]
MPLFHHRVPDHVRHAAGPGAKDFAILGATEAFPRGLLSTVLPIAMYRVLQDAAVVSEVYFALGLMSFLATLLCPVVARIVPRRWLYTGGVLILGGGSALVGIGLSDMGFGGLFRPGVLVPVGLAGTMVGTVVVAVCFNAYVMDFVERHSLGRSETLRLFYSAACWTLGPLVSVALLKLWAPAPFFVAAVASLVLLGVFWRLRLGNGKAIQRAKRRAVNPLSYLSRFVHQPRLVVGWVFAVMRSVAWWAYYVYMPILVIESGYDEMVSGIAIAGSNALLFSTPLMLKWMYRHSVRFAIVCGFLGSAVFFTAATVLVGQSWVAVGSLFVGTAFLILLDVSAGLPFLMAVRPSERTEMSAVYSTFRDVSGIIAPAFAWLVLLVAPVSAVFAATGASLMICGWLGSRLHPRLGERRGLPVPS